MDGGTAEREQAIRIKRTVKGNKRLSQKKDIAQASPMTRLQRSPRSSLEVENSAQADMVPDTEYIQDTGSRNETYVAAGSTDYEDDGSTDPVPLFDASHFSSMEIEQEWNVSSTDCPTPPLTDNTQNLGSLIPSLGTASDINLSPEEWMENLGFEAVIDFATLDSPADGSSLLLPIAQTTKSPSANDQDVLPESRLERSIVSKNHFTKQFNTALAPSSHLEDLGVGERRVDAMLLMYYLDHSFHLQFPFYDCSHNNHGRGWMLNQLLCNKAVYCAAVALSQQDQEQAGQDGMRRSSNSIQHKRGYGDYVLASQDLYDSLAGYQAWTGSKSTIKSIQKLTCALHLLFYEVRRLLEPPLQRTQNLPSPSYSVARTVRG